MLAHAVLATVLVADRLEDGLAVGGQVRDAPAVGGQTQMLGVVAAGHDPHAVAEQVQRAG